MKIESVPCEYFRGAKQIITTPLYIVVLTGSNILILTHKMEFVRKIEGLHNAYDGFLSPDGTHLLIVSTRMSFWMLSLERLDFLWKSKLKEPRHSFAEKTGTWSLDGTRFF